MKANRVLSTGAPLVVVGLLLGSTVLAQQPQLLADINQSPSGRFTFTTLGSASPSDRIVCGGLLYFVAGTAGDGLSLWRTDGTAAGTFVVKQGARPGATDVGGTTSSMAEVGGVLYFVAGSANTGMSLWRTDGTPSGTEQVQLPAGLAAPQLITNLVAMGGTLYFVASPVNNPTAQPADLWRTGGTTASTVAVRHAGAALNPRNVICVDQALFFWRLEKPTFAVTLWRSDGTDAGTGMLSTIVAASDGGDWLGMFTVAGSRLYFAEAGNGNNGSVWTSDGTAAGTYAVFNGGTPAALFAAGDKAVFWPYAVPPGGRAGLWSAGPAAGQSAWIADVRWPSGSVPGGTLSVGHAAYFNGSDAANPGSSDVNLYRTDGTASATVMLSAGPAQWLTPFGGAVYFSHAGLWRTDGTPSGTTLVTDLGSDDPWDWPPSATTVLRGSLVFFGWHGLWTSDGTANGTELVCSTVSGATASSNPMPFATLRGKFYFTADDGVQRRLWIADGTPEGSHPVDELATLSVEPHTPVLPFEGRAVFFGSVQGRRGMFLTDGTAQGTVGLAPIVTANAVGVGTRLYCSVGHEMSSDVDLWRSDGTPGGTRIVRSFAGEPGTFNGTAPLALTEGAVFLVVDDGSHGSEFWASDGTAAGTVMLTDLCRPPCSTNWARHGFNTPAAAGRFGFVTADSLDFAPMLIASDGTLSGTSAIYQGSNIGSLMPLGDTMFLGLGRGIGSSDGTSSGTHAITNLSGVNTYPGANYAGFDDTLFFPANDGVHGMQLWRINPGGTGAIQLANVAPGDWGSFPNGLAAVGRAVYFSATDNTLGQELWRTDGTITGTARVADLNPGAADSSPFVLGTAGNLLYLSADDGEHGREPWVMQFSDLPILDVADIAVTRTPSGSQNATFTVSISKPPSAPVTVHFVTVDWTARAGADYAAASGDLTFPAGSTTSRTISVPLLAGAHIERSLAFFLDLTDPSSAVLGQASAMAAITDPSAQDFRVRRHLKASPGP